MANVKYTLALLALLLVSSSTVHAQWVQSNGPYGGNVRAIVKSGSMIYAGLESPYITTSLTDVGGFYKSSDQGAHWVKSDAGIRNKSITMLTAIDSTILAGTNDGMYRSSDNGNSWSEVYQMRSIPIYSMAANESESYALVQITGDQPGLFRSIDKGESWKQIEYPPYMFTSLAMVGSTVFASTKFLGVWKSSDSGVTWNQISEGVGERVGSIKACGTSVFAFVDNTVYRLVYNGSVWKEVNKGLPNSEVRTVSAGKYAIYAVCPDSTNLDNKVYKSTDNGDNWTKLSVQVPPETIHCIEEIGENLFVGTRFNGIYRSSVSGGEWSLSNSGLAMKNITALYVTGSTLFAGTLDSRVYRSSNNGYSWDLFTVLGFSTQVKCFASSSTSLFIGSNSGVFRCTETDGNYTRVDSGITSKNCLALCYKWDNLFAGTFSGGIFRSSNNGNSWSTFNQGLTDTNVRCLLVRGGTIFAGTRNRGIFRCFDLLKGWEQMNNGLTDSNVTCLLEKGQDVFAGTQTAIFRTTDLGETWVNVSSGLDIKNGVISLSKVGTNLFAAMLNQGVYRSSDNGASWSLFNGGLPIRSVLALAAIDKILFAATSSASVMKTDISTVGIPEVEIPPVSLVCYPNPASNTLTIDRTALQLHGNTPVHYTLSTLVGGKVMEFDNRERKFTMQLEGIASGVYCLTAESAGNRAAVMVTVAE